MAAAANWAGNHVYRAGRAAPARDARAAARDRRARAARARARLAPLVQRRRRLGRAGRARRPAGRRRRRPPRPGTVSCSAGAEVRRAGRRRWPREGVALHNLASLPHISIAGADRHRHPRLGRRQRQPRHRGRAASSSSPPTATSSPCARGDAGLRRPRRRPRRARRRHARHPRRRARLRGAPARVRGAELGRAARALRRRSPRAATASASSRAGARRSTRCGSRAASPTRPRSSAASSSARVAATVDRHPILGLDPVNCTPQLGVPGRWSDRLPHFRMGFTPSNGEEIQSEYHVPRRHADGGDPAPCTRWPSTLRPVLQVSEIRTIAADELWMSPQYGQATVGLHFTWTREPEAVARVLVELEAALAPFAPRPHWGKVFLADGRRPSRRATSACPTSRAWRSAWTRAAPFATTGSSATSSGRRSEEAERSGGQAPGRREAVLEQRPRRGAARAPRPARPACPGGAGPRRRRSGAGRERGAGGRRRR